MWMSNSGISNVANRPGKIRPLLNVVAMADQVGAEESFLGGRPFSDFELYIAIIGNPGTEILTSGVQTRQLLCPK